MPLFGTLLNAAGILLGGILGLALRRQFKPNTQVLLKNILGLLVIWVGLSTTVKSLGGGVLGVAKQMTIVMLALILGRLTGRLLHLQTGLNRLGEYAKERFSKASAGGPQKWSEGFITCTVLFCVGPMAILGSIQDGLNGKWQTLGIKAAMDGLATMAFVGSFGWSAILSVVPVVAYQGTLTLAAKLLAPQLQNPALIDSVNATGGLLVFCISLIIFEIKKIELADYLPSLAWAPLLTWVWK